VVSLEAIALFFVKFFELFYLVLSNTEVWEPYTSLLKARVESSNVEIEQNLFWLK
jgi:hypothetical protein